MERLLAAIMATDVVGYSRLIRSDEEGTLAALRSRTSWRWNSRHTLLVNAVEQ